MRLLTRFVLKRTAIVSVCAAAVSVSISTGVRMVVGIESDTITIIVRLILPFVIAIPICLFWFARLERLELSYRKAIRKVNELARIASVDPLTGILNRRSFIEQFDIASRAGVRGWFILADIDYLKEINDHYGHVVGDDAVISVAQAMIKELPEDSLIARIGGDEFCAFILKSACPDINMVIDRFKQAPDFDFRIRQPHVEHFLSFTVGVMSVKPQQTFKEVMTLADARMYRNKRERHR